MNQKIIYQKLFYLNNLDLISKYNLQSIYLIPNCTKITFEIQHQQTIKKLISQYIIFFFCFFIFSQKPKLIYIFEKKKLNKSEIFSFEQKINAIFLITLQKRELFSFLHKIFLKNWKLLQINESYFLKSYYNIENKILMAELSLSSKIFFLDKGFPLAFNDIYLKLKFHIKDINIKTLKIKNYNSYIKNCYLFWKIL